MVIVMVVAFIVRRDYEKKNRRASLLTILKSFNEVPTLMETFTRQSGQHVSIIHEGVLLVDFSDKIRVIQNKFRVQLFIVGSIYKASIMNLPEVFC